MARGDGSVNTFVGVQSGLSMGSIGLLGDEEQKQRWLPAMAALDKIGAFALTEPNHGSDSVGLETTVHRDRDRWVLNGAKRWIGNASIADVIVVWARDTQDGRVKAIVVEKNPDGSYPDGYSSELITGRIGKRAVWQPDLTLRDVRVPLENKLAGAESFRDAFRVLTATRGGAAWESLGHAIAAYETALTYAAERIQFGKPIASFQLVQHKLAGMLAEITAMQLHCFRMAQLQEQGRWTGPMASLAKRCTTRGRPGRSAWTPATSSAATGCCSTTTWPATSPIWKSCTPTRAPTPSSRSSSAGTSPASPHSPEPPNPRPSTRNPARHGHPRREEPGRPGLGRRAVHRH
jgi:glutaryl-CoA dehydrogenase